MELEAADGEYEGEDVFFFNPRFVEPPLHRVQTLPFKWIQVLALLALLLTAFLLPKYGGHLSPRAIAYILVLSQLGLTLIFLILDICINCEHDRLHTLGYLRFCKDTKMAAQTPLLIILIVNSLVFLLSILQHHYCGEEAPECPSGCLRYTLSLALLVIEVGFISPPIFFYIFWCIRFNSRQVSRQDILLASTFNLANQRLGEETDTLTLLEMQADIIEHLTEQKVQLNWNLATLLKR